MNESPIDICPLAEAIVLALHPQDWVDDPRKARAARRKIKKGLSVLKQITPQREPIQ